MSELTLSLYSLLKRDQGRSTPRKRANITKILAKNNQSKVNFGRLYCVVTFIVTIFFFHYFFSFLQYRVSFLFNLICLVTTTFSRQIRNTVALILACHLFSLQHEISNSVAF